MKKLLIQTGNLKNKAITANIHKTHSNFTTAIVKKSVFSIINSFFLTNPNVLKNNTTFVDLFAGSGQMGFESISQHFAKTVFFEISKERFSSLRKQVLSFDGNIELFHKDAFRYFDKFEQNPNQNTVYFLDPPYDFWKNNFQKMKNLIDKIKQKDDVLLIFLQSDKDLALSDFQVRRFGKTYLHLFS